MNKQEHARQFSPTYICETYDKHGIVVRTEFLRTLSWAEFQFELDRQVLPVADVHFDSGPM